MSSDIIGIRHYQSRIPGSVIKILHTNDQVTTIVYVTMLNLSNGLVLNIMLI